MPIYEYECSSCHNVIEVTQRITEEPLTSCPDCSGTLKKLISMSAFHLKGKGWYADGYSSNTVSSKKTSGTDTKNSNKIAGSKSEESSTTTTKTEQTPANKKESKAPANVSKASAGV